MLASRHGAIIAQLEQMEFFFKYIISVKENLNVINPDKDSTLYEDSNQPDL